MNCDSNLPVDFLPFVCLQDWPPPHVRQRLAQKGFRSSSIRGGGHLLYVQRISCGGMLNFEQKGNLLFFQESDSLLSPLHPLSFPPECGRKFSSVTKPPFFPLSHDWRFLKFGCSTREVT